MNSISPRRSRQLLAGLLVAGQKPQADGNLRGVKQLAGQRDHAIHEVGFNQGLANLAFAAVCVDIEPLAMTKPATPTGER